MNNQFLIQEKCKIQKFNPMSDTMGTRKENCTIQIPFQTQMEQDPEKNSHMNFMWGTSKNM